MKNFKKLSERMYKVDIKWLVWSMLGLLIVFVFLLSFSLKNSKNAFRAAAKAYYAASDASDYAEEAADYASRIYRNW